jgi:mannan endo-1,4-beta-mannosidase
LKLSRIVLLLVFGVLFSASFLPGADEPGPVTPNASPEARELLKFLYSINGKYTLTGQHNFPNARGRNSEFASKYIGKTHVIFSSDFGFAKDGDKDAFHARPDIINEAIKQYKSGSIVALMWHAVPPTADEPVTFRPQSDNRTAGSLVSVSGQLTDEQFKDLLTPGTPLYKHWCAQVDSVAFYLKKLQAAHVPVLWRPYHEMNGEWFWWGGRRGEYSTAALYKQIFDRLVNYHKINNLIWVWSVDRPAKPERRFVYYFPGIQFVDILSLDVYGSDFNQAYYDTLASLSDGKLMTLAEVGNPPSSEILRNQPKWAYYITWAGMVRNTLKKQYAELINNPRIICQEDSAYINNIAPFRSFCGLSPLIYKKPEPGIAGKDFSGEWIFSEERSLLDNFGTGSIPDTMNIIQKGNNLALQKSFIEEYTDNRRTLENFTLDGKEIVSEMWGSPRITKAYWSDNSDTLKIDSKVTFRRDGNSIDMKMNESWSLLDRGKVLSITQSSDSFRGKRKIVMIYEKYSGDRR